jgi:DNA-binding NarL/FixJ family response regulator
MASRTVAERSEQVTRLQPQKRRLGVILVDPLPVVRAGMAMLIEDRPDLEVLAEAGSAEETLVALGRIRRHSVVLVGMNLEGERDAHWLIRTIRERFPAIAVLACGARSDPMAISRALFLGADGYVDKNIDPVEFLQTIRQAADGEMVLAGPPNEWVGAIAEGLEQRHEIETRLTEREREVLSIAAEGLTAREIAGRLGVRERTVTTHLGRIYGKLGVGTRVAAIRVAAQSGLVSVGSPY